MIRKLTATIVVLAVVSIATTAAASGFSLWGQAVNAETAITGTSSELNTASNDGCPYQSPDGLSLYMASNRPGGLGGLDIWVASRASASGPWGAPVNLGAPVNSEVDDFCPTPTLGGGLFFVSARAVAGACGGPDIYFVRQHHGAWSDPANLGCGVNSAAAEASPSFVLEGFRPVLYFSSNRPGGFASEAPGAVADSDIYVSSLTWDGFGVAALVPGLNTAANDSRPNVLRDGREIVFDSDRDGTAGGADIYSATRRFSFAAWLAPANLGPAINTDANETRASFSWDGKTLYFGSTRPGVEGFGDIFVSTRVRTYGH